VLEVHRPIVLLSGRVVDERDRPVADALVTVDRLAMAGDAAGHFPVIDRMSATPPVVTDADGRFTIETLPAPHELTVQKASAGLYGRLVPAVPGGPNLVRVRGGGGLRGVVVGAGAGPCRVRADGYRSATTVGRGDRCEFSFSELPAGPYVLTATRGDWTGYTRVEVVPGRAVTVEIVSAALGTLTGRFVDGDGRGVPDLLVIAVGADEGATTSMMLEAIAGTHPRTDGDGRVTLRVPVGEVKLGVFSPDVQRVLHRQQVALTEAVHDLGVITIEP
jgi:hypothetical protein